jgi:hypothetical protein
MQATPPLPLPRPANSLAVYTSASLSQGNQAPTNAKHLRPPPLHPPPPFARPPPTASRAARALGSAKAHPHTPCAGHPAGPGVPPF